MIWFDGKTYVPALDESRLGAQLFAVKRVMSDGKWRSLAELAATVEAPEASVSARLRDLRKRRFGSHIIQRRRRSPGTHEYRLER